ncbi:MAG: 5-formyltetrahydrofolate cyclo-ligase [Treponema sp.]|nr:5-formyltetrahydrofolate cyclo-ligase [Treponema sp.]
MNFKDELRKTIKTLCSQNRGKLAEQSRQICSRILSSPQYKNADQIFAYMALWDEVDLSDVIQAALQEGKKAAVPKITDLQKGLMQFYYLNPVSNGDAQNQTKKGSLGIEEPDEAVLQTADVTQAKNTLILVPGRAFTKNGDRLGRGKGFYDIFLSGLEQNKASGTQITKAGVCFSFQLVDNIPVTASDIIMDFIF